MKSLADRVILAWGWRRALIALIAGAIGALAMPPFGFWPALAVSLTGAVWLIDGSASGRGYSQAASLRSAAIAGWFWGLGYFVAGLWWIGSAFLVEADIFAWLLPFGVLGLPALLAFFPAAGFAIARALWSPGAARLLALAFGLGLSEWLRGHLFTGFPWNAPGMALAQNLWLMQSGSVFGLYGLTMIAILLLSSPATIGTASTWRGRLAPPALAALALAAIALFGALRIPSAPMPSVAGVKLRIMQPNLAQDAKFSAENAQEILTHYIELSGRATSPDTPGLAGVTHLIWPESAFPFLLHREPGALSQIAAMLPPGAVLVTGAARLAENIPGETGRRFLNAVQVVGGEGAILASYDKVHLVPFGEYVPHFLDSGLRSLGLRQFVQMPGGFTAGERHLALDVPGLSRVAATVCYEAIFPDEIMPPGPRPGLILNVTNDAWFGDTPGPWQHLAQARLRAVEEGLPLVRAANTGVSAVFDPYGRILATLPVGVEGVLDSSLPRPLDGTIFGSYGGALSLVLLFACGALAAVARFRSPRAVVA